MTDVTANNHYAHTYIENWVIVPTDHICTALRSAEFTGGQCTIMSYNKHSKILGILAQGVLSQAVDSA